MRVLAGWLLGWIVRVWLATLRLTVVDRTGEARASTRPWILAFFHGTQVPLLAWRRRRKTSVLVSLSRDGGLSTAVMRRAGMVVVRGSSSRGGARALLELVRAVREQALDAAFAVDGPRGPYGSIAPGVLACARHVDGLVVPIGSACAPRRVLSRAWDKMALPWPFARAVVVLGSPLPPTVSTEELAAAILQVNRIAQDLLGTKVLPVPAGSDYGAGAPESLRSSSDRPTRKEAP